MRTNCSTVAIDSDVVRKPRRRLLFVAPMAPSLDGQHGGARVMAQTIAAFAERHTVGIVYLRAAGEPGLGALEGLCDLTVEVERPWATSLAGRWRRRTQLARKLLTGNPLWASRWHVPAFAYRLRAAVAEWHPEIVQFEYHVMAQYASDLAGCSVSRVLVEHEPGAIAARDVQVSARGAQRLLAWAERTAWSRYERRVIRNVDAVVTFTEPDRATLLPLAGHTRVVTIPFGTLVPPRPLNHAGVAPTLVFVGSFRHYPNVDAAMRLITGIFPRVRARCRVASLEIIGSDPPTCLHEAAMGDVEVLGSLPDITERLDRAAVVVAPLRLGGGMRVKVIEALAAGKAVVCSRLAIEGLNVVDGREVRLAETDAEFADAIVELLEHPESRQALAARARAWASMHAGWDRPVAAYEALYDSLTPERTWQRH